MRRSSVRYEAVEGCEVRIQHGRLSRRELLRQSAASTAALWLACGADAGGRMPGRADRAPPLEPIPAPTPGCLETEVNVLGPYWIEGAPRRSDLIEAGLAGTRLQITGRVLGLASAACRPLAGAMLDVWHSDDRGDAPSRYSTATTWRLRGRLYTGADGSYALRTIVPGRYLDGNGFRPAHIHVRVHAPGYRRLTTQLYFQGDPYNATDRFIRESLIMTLRDAGAGKVARFDFVIAATRDGRTEAVAS